MYIDSLRIERAVKFVARSDTLRPDLAAQAVSMLNRSYLNEFFSEQDVLTLEKIELAEMGIDGVCA